MAEPMVMRWQLDDGPEAVLQIFDSTVPPSQTVAELEQELRRLKGRRLRVELNSASGDAETGLAIYGALRRLPEVQLFTHTQFAANGAVPILLAAPLAQRSIATDGVILLQSVNVYRIGDQPELSAWIRSVTGQYMGILYERTGLWDSEWWDEAASRQMFFVGSVAFDNGLVGKVTNEPKRTSQAVARRRA